MPAEHETPARQPHPGIGRPLQIVLVVAGWACMVLALAGVFLPLVPTTPLVLLAAACFLRASPRLHRRLLRHPRLGPLLLRWARDRAVPRAAKRKAYLLVVVSFAITTCLVDPLWLRVLLCAIGLGVIAFLASLRTVEELDAERADACERKL